jgi:hypothetical protein
MGKPESDLGDARPAKTPIEDQLFEQVRAAASPLARRQRYPSVWET